MTRTRNVADIIKQPFTTTLGTSNYRAGVNAGNSIASGGNFNVTVGDEAGTAINTGDNNIAIGYAAGDAINTGSLNTYVGSNAGSATTSVSNNTAVGAFAFDAGTGADNTAVGSGALGGSSNSGAGNVAMGKDAGNAVTTGANNTLIGSLTADSMTTGASNTFVGFGVAGDAVVTGSNNTAMGNSALVALIGGANNTCIGAEAGANITSGDSNIMIGKDIDAASATADNQINIGGQIISDNTFVTIPKIFRAGDATASALTHGSADRAASFVSDLRTDSVLVLHNTDGSYSTYVQRNSTVRAANSAFTLLGTTTGNLGDDQHRLRGDGQTLADGAYSSGGADYAEYFEWADGNSDNEDRRGCSVVLSGSKMRIATSDDSASNIIGVISSNASVIGDGDMSRWKNKYLRDDFGGYDLDSNGDRKPNPNYNPDLEYVSRELRLEWETVGLMGKLRIKKGQPIGTNWIKMRDVSDQVEEWLVR